MAFAFEECLGIPYFVITLTEPGAHETQTRVPGSSEHVRYKQNVSGGTGAQVSLLWNPEAPQLHCLDPGEWTAPTCGIFEAPSDLRAPEAERHPAAWFFSGSLIPRRRPRNPVRTCSGAYANQN